MSTEKPSDLLQRVRKFYIGKTLGFQRHYDSPIEEFTILDFTIDVAEDGVPLVNFIGDQFWVAIGGQFVVFLSEKDGEEWKMIGEGESEGLIYKDGLTLDGAPLGTLEAAAS